jgi:hypothetical protein
MLSFLKRLHASEQGAEGLEKLLIIAAIVLPLLGFLIFARDWITSWVGDQANTVRGNADNAQTNF